MKKIEEDRLESAVEIIRSVAALPSEDQTMLVERQVLRTIFRAYWMKFNGGRLTRPSWGPDEGRKALLELAGHDQARGMGAAFRFFLRRTHEDSKNKVSPSDARNLLLMFQLTKKAAESPYVSQDRPSYFFSGQDAEGVLRSTIEDLKRYEERAQELLLKAPSDARLRAKVHAYAHAADLLEDAILRLPLIDERQGD